MKKCWVFLAVIFLIMSSNAGAIPSNALPNGGSVAAGAATITQSANHLQINQQSQKAIINWKSFNIGSQASTHFQQPAQGIALNRVNPNQGASQIFGRLTATGKIILVNQAGIYFAPGAYVNVGGIIASTSDISNANFLSGNYVFDKPSTQNGAVVNKGTIIAKENGLVALIGNGVSNEGLIQARTGNVVLASGNKFTVSLSGDQLINFTVDEGSSTAAVDANGNKLKNGVSNSGKILADGGTVIMTAKTARNVVDNAINMSGIVEARSVAQENGMIILAGDEGSIVVSGKMDVSGAAGKGGVVKVLAKDIHIANSARIYADGKSDGGTILIGGNKQGKGPEHNAKKTIVDQGAILSANATDSGNGGNIIVWSDDYTQFHGLASATGGVNGGNGGFVETSGKYLDVSHAFVDTKAAKGSYGTWLLDPTDIYIANDLASANALRTAEGNPAINDTTADEYNATNPYNFSTLGTDSPASLLTISTLLAALSNGNVVIQTDNSNPSAGGFGDIKLVNNFSWNAPTKLTLSAYRDVILYGSIQGANSSSQLKLQADNTGTGIGSVCGAGGNSVCGGEITPASGTLFFSNVANQVSVYYNPTTFGTQNLIFGSVFPTRYMLINSLGSQGDTTTSSLASLSNNPAFANQNFALSKNIDASATSGWGSTQFIPINNYSGRFDGQDHTISNLFVTTTSNAGLFGSINSGAAVSNLGLINPTIIKNNAGNTAGTIAGTTAASTQLSNVYSQGGSVTYNGIDLGTVGGLVGTLGGNLTNAYSTTSVNANNLNFPLGFNTYIGGLVGLINTGGAISNSYSVNNVNGTILGGVPILNMGGIAGGNVSTVSQSILNSYSLSNLNFVGAGGSSGTVGGLVGSNGGNIYNSYAITPISTSGFAGTTGGLIGTNTGAATANNSFWDTGLIANAIGGGSTSCPGCGALTQLTSTYSGAGWNIGLPGSTSVWQMLDNVIYPHLNIEGLYTIQGTIYGDSAGTTPVGSGVTVNLAVNGGTPFTTTTDGSGQYTFLFSTNSANPVPNGNVATGSHLLIFPSSDSQGNLIFSTNGQSVNSANILDQKIISGVSGGNAISNAIMKSAKGILSDPNIFYNTSGFDNSITAANGFDFLTNSNFILNGNIDLVNGNFLFNNTISLVNAATVNLRTNLGSVTGTNVGDFTFLGRMNGTGKSVFIRGFDTTPITITFNNSTNSGNINVVGGLSNNSTLVMLTDPTTQIWTLADSFLNNGTITGLTGNPTFTFSRIKNVVGSNILQGASFVTNTWNITGNSSGNMTAGVTTFNFNGFNTLQSNSNSSEDIFNIASSGYITNINGNSINPAMSTVNYATYTGPISATTSSVTSTGGTTHLTNVGNLIGNDGTSNANSTINATTDFTIKAANAGVVDGIMNFSGFGNIIGGNTFNFIDSGSIVGSLTPNPTGTNTINFTGLSGSPNINVTLTSPGSNHGVQGTATSVIGGTFDDIDAINNTSSAMNTLTAPNTPNFWSLDGTGSGALTQVSFSFSGFPNINGGSFQNSFNINPGAVFDVINTENSTTGGNQFHLFGGTINTIHAGQGSDNNIIFNDSGSPMTVTYSGANSGNISGAATISEFTDIDVVNNAGSDGNTYNIDNTVGVIVTGNNAIVNIGSTGNIGLLSGGTGGSYSISGIINALNTGGNSSFILNTGANITSITAGGSADSNSLTLNNNSSNVLNINGTSGSLSGGSNVGGYSNIGNITGSNNGDTFNINGTLNSITGGSGADTFMLNSTANVASLNGGAGNNTLQALAGSPTWNITGTNSGNIAGMVSSFSNMNNLTGSSTGTNTFKFLSASPITGLIDGGNITNTNIIDVSAVAEKINLVLGPKPSAELNQGIFSTSSGTTLATFTQVQKGIGNGGLLTTNPTNLMNSLTITDASTHSGFISDPFFFVNFLTSVPSGETVTPTVFVDTFPLIPNIITGAGDLVFQDSVSVGDLYTVDENLTQIINNLLEADIKLNTSNTYSCFQ